MTVAELIDWLKSLPPEAEVFGQNQRYLGPAKVIQSAEPNRFYITCDNPDEEDD